MAEKLFIDKRKKELDKKFKRKDGFKTAADFSKNAARAARTAGGPPPGDGRKPFGNITMSAMSTSNAGKGKWPLPPNTPPSKKANRTPFSPGAMFSPHAAKLKKAAGKAVGAVINSPFSPFAKRRRKRKAVKFDAAGPVSINFVETAGGTEWAVQDVE